MRPLVEEWVFERLEKLEALDRVGKPLQKAVRSVVPSDSALKDLLSGTWLGHPLHPLLTDVVIGAWTSAWFLDIVGGKRTRAASDRLIGIGILAALPTAASGLSDWADVDVRTRRLGVLHATGNVSALSLYTLSYLARKSGRRATGWLLSMLGAGAATTSAYIGGHLAFRKGVGVNQTAFEPVPRNWTRVLSESDLPQGRLTSARAGEVGVVLYRDGNRVFALLDRCSHRGCSLSDGAVRDLSVVCPCHGSTFDLEDGHIVKGPAIAPQPALEARTRGGDVEVRPKR